MGTFRDYIPAGEDVGSQTSKGFVDFVPEPPLVKREEPEIKEEVKEEVKEVVEEVKPLKKKKK